VELLIAITNHKEKRGYFVFLGSETQKIINCEHVIVQHVVLLFSQLNFNKLMRWLCKEYVRRKVKNAPGVTLHRNFAFARTPFSSKVITCLEPVIQSKNQSLVSGQLQKNHMSNKPEPTVWSYDTGQWIACFDSCQLTITWIPTIKEIAVIMVLLSVFKVLVYVWTDVRTRWWHTDGCTDILTYRQSHDYHSFLDQWVPKFSKVWDSAHAPSAHRSSTINRWSHIQRPISLNYFYGGLLNIVFSATNLATPSSLHYNLHLSN